ncbi:molybdenum cofactor guanylyltransferase [Pseudogracilibacillus sp. SE30717A]|uniref:molybdenum cofactor guanylyltransferase n=1 Tax=Pseudogracilibacillus sp. SE30717A TaxID=3098293 RepID=UPI00300E1A5B
MSNSKSFVGILLAGGLSRRYGTPKAFAMLNEQNFYQIAYQILLSICDEVVIVTRPEFTSRFPKDNHVIVDVEEFSGCGPLAGIYSGMDAIDAENYVVLPCDMPLMTTTIMKHLLTFHTKKVTIINTGDYLQPLVSVWDKEVKDVIYSFLKNGRFRITDVLKQTEVVEVDASRLTETPQRFLNINTPQEDKEMRKWKGF